ncbi:DUF2971 domain-containing protein [Vitreoscilla massiliensis]|uniref:DUF2971 domain-containing protein n=1 Tax=Vitreoscilla massiliensis TaxID=1689272 RepID=A0ABY4DY38_9NEIS|nr:DUF2971 domain-containing protein [Vitreoscilla massiliensis]UOO88026.1 DUF2971 domain-containing protein [Vitreoscilla massiliensis]
MKVYKYRGVFERDLNSLELDQFWASTTNQLNDPCEGLLISDNLEQQLHEFSLLIKQFSTANVEESKNSLMKSIKNILSMKDNRLGIFSLSKVFDDELLWAHYANSHYGFCIEFNLNKLTSLYYENKYTVLDVIYTDHPPKLDFQKLLTILEKDTSKQIQQQMLGYKSKRWEYENEIRIISDTAQIQNYDFRAVTAIYFGLRMAESEIQQVMRALQGRGIKYFQMQLKNNSFKLEAIPLPDAFPHSPKYKYSVAPIAKDAIAPQYLKEEHKQYADYLYKAGEILRRDPYCLQLDDVNISDKKSENGEPTIYGSYASPYNKYKKQYLTLAEIDTLYSQIDDLETSI